MSECPFIQIEKNDRNDVCPQSRRTTIDALCTSSVILKKRDIYKKNSQGNFCVDLHVFRTDAKIDHNNDTGSSEKFVSRSLHKLFFLACLRQFPSSVLLPVLPCWHTFLTTILYHCVSNSAYGLIYLPSLGKY